MPGGFPSGAVPAASGNGVRRRAGPKRAAETGRVWRLALASGTAVLALWPAGVGWAQAAGETGLSTASFGALEAVQFAVFAGAMGAALLAAVVMIRERARIAVENSGLRARVAELSAGLSRAEALFNLRDQRVVVWGTEHKRPEIMGALPAESGAPEDRASFLAFGRWLASDSAARLDRAVAKLRDRGTLFDLVVETQAGHLIEVQGKRSAGHVLLRFLSLSERQAAAARLAAENIELQAERTSLFGLLDALDMPFWLRGADGRLRHVNPAFARAVEARDPEGAIAAGREFPSASAREQISRAQGAAAVFSGELTAVVGGDRRVVAVTDVAGEEGSAGLAVDRTALSVLREELAQTLRSHADTLDRLTTAVAIFDRDQKLRFFNQAFQALWDLDAAFLDSAPDNALLLDRLRSEGRIAEQPEWRRWKENLLSVYRALSPQEHLWHLPDGRTLRVVANPQPTGGATWVFENLTERIDLESRYRTAVRVQGETLDNLAEGVAVFGPDGRARLFNPAFSALWNLDGESVAAGTHISALRTACDRAVKGGAPSSPWGSFVAAVTGFDEERRDRSGQCELAGGRILRWAIIHLPNGQVMLTFVDVTDTVQVERALKEKNDALERADQLKNDFVQHVSYELRSPLTNIIGFTDLLALPSTGPLTRRQREYLDHIGSSSATLLTVVNDILDLATVDAGIMELDVGEVRVRETAEAAAALIADRLGEHGIKLELELGAAPESFWGDEMRVRQILYNLLSNAVNYAPEGSTVLLSCSRTHEGLAFRVHDDGPGMPPDVLDTVFRRFERHANGGRRRGAGLGLSVVKSFVELHGGSVRIETGESRGTTVTCFFPSAPTDSSREAAE